jgi:hypothetical protein
VELLNTAAPANVTEALPPLFVVAVPSTMWALVWDVPLAL